MKTVSVILNSSCKAKPISGKGRLKPLWFTNEFPKALGQLSRIKKIGGTQWKAVLRYDKIMSGGYIATERILPKIKSPTLKSK